MSARKTTTRRRAIEPETEQSAETAAPAAAGEHICGWCITRDCDNCRPKTGRWTCTCDHSRRLPSPAETYGAALTGGVRDGDEFL